MERTMVVMMEIWKEVESVASWEKNLDSWLAPYLEFLTDELKVALLE